MKVVQDILFKTSNDLYDLKLPLKSLPPQSVSRSRSDLDIFTSFLDENPSTKFLRLQYLDYTATPRVRILPVKRVLSLLETNQHLLVGITKACLGLLQNDHLIPEVTATGEYKLRAILSSLRPGPQEGYASVQGEFREHNGLHVEICPRSVLRRRVQEAKSHGLEFLVGFEIEIVFMSRVSPEQKHGVPPGYGGHAWSSARALHGNDRLNMLTEIYDTLASAGIYLEQWHPEGATGQYEFILPPLPPLEAVDTLLHAREIITSVAAKYSLRATLYPKPFPDQPGTASHVHISICSPDGDDPEIYEAFYAGILGHLRSIVAFTYSNAASYDRMADGCWAGGRWVAWGTQNRETALRKVAGSHWEIKVVDGLANAYLATAAIIAAGTQGVMDEDELLQGDCTVDPANLSRNERGDLGVTQMLPKDLGDAVWALENDKMLKSLLGEDVVERYFDVKKAEGKMLNGMSDEDRREWIIELY